MVSTGWPLIGRAEELTVMGDAIAVPDGPGGIVLAGAAGVGKSRLARESVERARRMNRQCRWIYATGSARSVPLGAFAQYASSFGPDPLHRIHDVIAALTDGRPPMATVVAIDDAHLLDEQSALVVHQLVLRRLATVVVTVRSGEPAPDAITSLYKDHGLPRLELQPLSAGDVGLLLQSLLSGAVESATAQRIWRYTQGNVLYLRQLLADETARGQITNRSGLWVWTGHPEVSPALVDLIEANVGRHRTDVLDVLDHVALADPLELSVLHALVDARAIDEAEADGLIVVDGEVVRLGHPMLGEARRRRLGTMRRTDASRRIANAIAALCPPTPQQLVRRAVLTADSGDASDAAMLVEAAGAAMHLLDLRLALEFAERAVKQGGGVPAQLTLALAMVTAGRAAEGDELLNELATTAQHDADRAQVGLFHAGNLAWNLGRPVDADTVLTAAYDAAARCGMAASYDGIRVSTLAARGHPSAAVQTAAACRGADMHGGAAMLCSWGLVAALGNLGDIAGLSDAAAKGYQLAATVPEASHLRFGLGMMHVDGMRLAGRLGEVDAVAHRLHREARDLDMTLSVTTMLLGVADLSRGELASAQRWFRESHANASGNTSEMVGLSGVWLAMALGKAGDVSAAREALDTVDDHFPDDFVLWDPHRRLAHAWVDAAAGVVTSARRMALEAAEVVRAQGRPALEVWCLQAATQFGESTTASRAAELVGVVAGPRAAAVAQHAAALAEPDGKALLAASRAYEEFGDRVAASDAAAQAVAAFRQVDARGSALSAAAVAARMSQGCGADTPALRAISIPTTLTPRQAEIIALVAVGHSNREIAERLVMSVRSVEGHIFRASRRTGVNSRDELAALLRGRPQPVDEVE